mmetsp:Transcript_14317/g.26756  ORF Transcript_14317/g.26756 Transcript_14317/m.26756 type:complete len:191 (+) Transcript_14317:75-647(+)
MVEETVVAKKQSKLSALARRLHGWVTILDEVVPPVLLLLSFAVGVLVAVKVAKYQTWIMIAVTIICLLLSVTCALGIARFVLRRRLNKKVFAEVDKLLPGGFGGSLFFGFFGIASWMAPETVVSAVLQASRGVLTSDSIERALNGERCTIVFDFVRKAIVKDEDDESSTGSSDSEEPIDDSYLAYFGSFF